MLQKVQHIEREEVPEEDVELFDYMRDKYVSNNERRFFEIMEYKEYYELAPQNDIILHENDNDECLFLLRVYNTEYEIGRLFKNTQQRCFGKYHSMSLSEALFANLKKASVLDYECTLLQWLRKVDYHGLCYEGNYNDEYLQNYNGWK